jgi:hypothetical protein
MAHTTDLEAAKILPHSETFATYDPMSQATYKYGPANGEELISEKITLQPSPRWNRRRNTWIVCVLFSVIVFTLLALFKTGVIQT